MTGSRASASADPRRRTLVCGVNWIGDTVMSLPALQAYRSAHPDAAVAILVKPGLVDLWSMSPVPDQVLVLEQGAAGLARTARALRRGGFDEAYVLPHSFRSALLPFLAGIPVRRGMPGHSRDFLLTSVVPPRRGPGREHQAYEYLDLVVPDTERLEPPRLLPGPAAQAEAADILAPGDTPWVGVLPGAARGPSKRWPAEAFGEVGRRLQQERGFRMAVMGAPSEAALCDAIVKAMEPGALNLAGRTTLPVWAAALDRCAAVVCNDSGGMHLAAAVGTPVVAVYGITDPARTGPLGPARILQHATRRDRDVPRDAPEARLSLASITPQEVYEAVCMTVTKS